ncbi:MAG: hypothetical protein ACFWTJ_10275 [Lachnoclostridium sp.]|jgi:UPF0755 protein
MTAKPTSTQLVLKIVTLILRLLLNILFYTIVAVLLIRACKITYNFGYEIFGQVTASAEPGRDIEITINKGESTWNVASKLELNKIIVNKYSFFVKAKLKKYVIMPGTYSLNTSMTYDDIFSIITKPSSEEKDTSEKSNTSSESKKDDNSTESEGTKETQDTDSTKDDN